MQKPDLSTVHIIYPGLPEVLSWPVVLNVPFTVSLVGDDTRFLWPNGMFTEWETWPRDVGKGPRPQYGNSGVIYTANGRLSYPKGKKVCDITEYLQEGYHPAGVVYETYGKFTRHGDGGGIPEPGTMIGYFVAGPCRYSRNLPIFQHRTQVWWGEWTGEQGPIEPWVFDGTEPTPPPPPVDGMLSDPQIIDAVRRVPGLLR